MNKKEFKQVYAKTCRMLRLAPHEFRVSASGALLMMGLREGEVADIDGEVDRRVYHRLVKVYKLKTSLYDGHIEVAHAMEEVDIHPVDNIQEGVMIEGIWCDTPENILALKMRLNRPKDQDDIQKLKAFLAKKR